MAHCCSLVAIFSFAALLSLTQLVVATQYAVGGSSGWGLGVDYSTWASQYTFRAGDSLYFSYAAGSHSVLQVSEQDYQGCSTSNPISSDNSAGNKVVHLTTAGKYYFICGVIGHCGQGMQLAVTVSSGASSTSSPGSLSPPASTSPSTPSTSTPSTSSYDSSSASSVSSTAALLGVGAMAIAYHLCMVR